MKLAPNEKYTTIAVYILIVTLVTLTFIIICFNFDILLSAFSMLMNVIRPIIYGFVFAFLLLPLVKLSDNYLFKWIAKKKPLSKVRRLIGVLFAWIVAAVFIMIFGFTFIPQVTQNYHDFQIRIADYITVIQRWLNTLAESSDFFAEQYSKVYGLIIDFITDTRELLNKVTPVAIDFIGSVVTETKNIGLGVIISVYFLMAKERLAAVCRRIVRAILPDRAYDYVLHAAKLSYVTFSEFIIGETLDSILMGMILFSIMNIFGIPYAPIISLLVGITFFIPSIGGFIGAVPSTLLVLIAAPEKALWFLIIIIGLQLVDCLLIEPKILSEQNSMSALWVLLAIVIMSALLGFWGLIIGVPLFMIIRTLIKEALENRLRAKELPCETSNYYGDIS